MPVEINSLELDFGVMYIWFLYNDAGPMRLHKL